MSKKIIAAFIVMFVFTNTAFSQSDASITWSVSGVAAVKEIEMDVKFTTRYMAVNGSITATNNLSLPVTGTCFTTVGGGVLCNFFTGGGLMMVLDLQPSLSGTVKSFDENQILKDSGILTLTSIF